MAAAEPSACHNHPNFAVICSFLSKYGELLGIEEITFNDLEVHLENTTEVPIILRDLLIKLLRRWRSSIKQDKWTQHLAKFCFTYSEIDGWEIERVGYQRCQLSTKLRILKNLLERQFDCNIRFKEKLNGKPSNDLRYQPIGRDKNGHAYWCLMDSHVNLRIFREDEDDIDSETWEIVVKSRSELEELISNLENCIVDKENLSRSATPSTNGSEPDLERIKHELKPSPLTIGSSVKMENDVKDGDLIDDIKNKCTENGTDQSSVKPKEEKDEVKEIGDESIEGKVVSKVEAEVSSELKTEKGVENLQNASDGISFENSNVDDEPKYDSQSKVVIEKLSEDLNEAKSDADESKASTKSGQKEPEAEICNEVKSECKNGEEEKLSEEDGTKTKRTNLNRSEQKVISNDNDNASELKNEAEGETEENATINGEIKDDLIENSSKSKKLKKNGNGSGRSKSEHPEKIIDDLEEGQVCDQKKHKGSKATKMKETGEMRKRKRNVPLTQTSDLESESSLSESPSEVDEKGDQPPSKRSKGRLRASAAKRAAALLAGKKRASEQKEQEPVAAKREPNKKKVEEPEKESPSASPCGIRRSSRATKGKKPETFVAEINSPRKRKEVKRVATPSPVRELPQSQSPVNCDAKNKKKKRRYDGSDEEFVPGSKGQVAFGKNKKKRKRRGKRELTPDSSDDSHDEEEEEDEDDESLKFNESEEDVEEESDASEYNPQGRNYQRSTALKKKLEEGVSVEDDRPCTKCGKFQQPEWILLCDFCDAGYHTACLRPPLMLIPSEDWYCPPCQHLSLIKNLKEQLVLVDKEFKNKDRLIKRKERLAFVGISIENIIKKEEKKPFKNENYESDAEEYDSADDYSESGSEYGGEENVRPKKKSLLPSRRPRKPISYKFSDFDKQIGDAVGDDLKSNDGSDTKGQGKEMKNIVDAEGKGTEIMKKRKGRRLTALSDNDDEDDDDSDDYEASIDSGSGRSNSSEEESGSTSDEEWGVGHCKKKKTRSTRRSRRSRRIRKFVADSNSESEYSSEESRPLRRAVTSKKVNYIETESDDSDEPARKGKVPRPIPRPSGKKIWDTDSEEEKGKRRKNGARYEEDSEYAPSDSEVESVRPPRKKMVIRGNSSSNESPVVSEEEEKSEPAKKSRRVLDTSSDEEEQQPEKKCDEATEKESDKEKSDEDQVSSDECYSGDEWKGDDSQIGADKSGECEMQLEKNFHEPCADLAYPNVNRVDSGLESSPSMVPRPMMLPPSLDHPAENASLQPSAYTDQISAPQEYIGYRSNILVDNVYSGMPASKPPENELENEEDLEQVNDLLNYVNL